MGGKGKKIYDTTINLYIQTKKSSLNTIFAESKNRNDGEDIGNEKTQTIALSDAGVAKDEVIRLNFNRNVDDGRIIYGVDFTVSSKGAEYDFEVDASTRAFLEWQEYRVGWERRFHL